MSKYIDNFEVLNDYDSSKRAKVIRKSENFANFFAANALLQDYDIHGGNVGIVTSNGKHYLARIDNGRALSYNVERKFAGGGIKPLAHPQTIDGFQGTMLSLGYYSSDMFKGAEFAINLYETANKLNLTEMRDVILDNQVF